MRFDHYKLCIQTASLMDRSPESKISMSRGCFREVVVLMPIEVADSVFYWICGSHTVWITGKNNSHVPIRFIRTFNAQNISWLFGAQTMIHQLLVFIHISLRAVRFALMLQIHAIENSLLVMCPLNTAELHAFQQIGQIVASRGHLELKAIQSIQ